MLQPDYYFPQGKATRANYRQAWHYILKNHRYMFIKVKNNTSSDLFVRYLGHAGVTLPTGSDYRTYKLRFPGDYVSAIRYHNEMLQDAYSDANSEPAVVAKILIYEEPAQVVEPPKEENVVNNNTDPDQNQNQNQNQNKNPDQNQNQNDNPNNNQNPVVEDPNSNNENPNNTNPENTNQEVTNPDNGNPTEQNP